MVTQVKAQVMTRDDSTGGWVPVSGGGLSIVALVCRKVPLVSGDEVITDITPIGVEFVIQGRRITDHEVAIFIISSVDVSYCVESTLSFLCLILKRSVSHYLKWKWLYCISELEHLLTIETQTQMKNDTIKMKSK